MVRPIRLITPISIHALRKESDRLVNILVISDTISIHALRKESDILPSSACPALSISIHALRKESDLRRRRCDNVKTDFNPRSP